jgi:polysaccharide chain length determinant protein (PEP-CTERM system associated)
VTVEAARAIWDRRWRLALAVLAVTVTVVVTIALGLPAVYRSTATVLVARPEMALTNVSTREVMTGELEARLNRIGERILSRSRLEALIDEHGLYGPDANAHLEDSVNRLRRDIRVDLKGVDPAQGRGMTFAFTVGVRGRDPETVARIANQLASQYVAENSAIRERRAAAAVAEIKREVEEAQRRLDEQDRRTDTFKRRNMGQLPEQVAANLAMLERLNAQLALNNHNQIRVMERRASMARRGDDMVMPTAATPEEALTVSLAQMNANLAKLQRQYSDKYPDIIILKKDIETTRRQLAELGPGKGAKPTAAGSPGRDMDPELTALKAEDERLRRQIAAYQSRVEMAPERDQELQQIARDHRATREMYETVLKRYRDAQAAADIELNRAAQEFQLLEPAVAAREPAAPNRPRLILIGLVLALAATGVAVMLAEQLDTSFHGLDDVRSFTKLPVLASIPQLTTRADIRRRTWRTRVAAGAGVVALLVIGGAAYLGARHDLLIALLTRTGS